LRVLHVIETLGVGGAEQMLVNLLPELNALGCECAVAVHKPPFELVNALEAQGIRVYKFEPQGKWNLVKGANQTALIAHEFNADIIHSHLLFPSVYNGLARIFRLTHCLTAVTYHNLAYADGVNKRSLGLALRKSLNSFTSRFGMNRCFAVSEAVAAHYKENLRLPAVSVVFNPIPVDRIDAIDFDSTDDTRVDQRLFRIVIPGRLVKEKGHEVLFAALELLAEGDRFAIEVLVAGAGPLKSELERVVLSRGLTSQLKFLGGLAYTAMLRTMKSADLVVVPSHFEGFGMTAAEAMCLNVPVIVSSAGGLPEIVENNVSGIVFPVDDEESLAKAITGLMLNPSRRAELAKAGRLRVLKNYASPKVAGVLYQRYAAMIKQG
jgi:glycosyltransferase involved in cell wall biosynthesis